MKYAELIAETETELNELENKQKLVQFQKRISFLRLLKSGAASTQEQAGRQVGWKLRQAQKIWRLYREGGVAGVLQKNERWQTGKLTSEQRTELIKQLSASGGESLAAVQNYIEQAFGICYSIGGVSVLCQRLKIKLKTARPTNVKKDEQQVAAYKKTLPS
jgi:transposase